MLKQQIGQMLIMGFHGVASPSYDTLVQAICVKQLGGVILFAQNVLNPAQLAAMTRTLHANARESGYERLLVGMDYEGGTVDRLGESAGFPPTVSAARLGLMEDESIRQYAKIMASTLTHASINLNFAPCVDVNENPANPIIGKRERSFSCSPVRVTECAVIFADTYESHGIISTFKHFPGHGSSTGDTHEGFVDVTDTWDEEELVPYRQLLPRFHHHSMVMMAHVVNRNIDPDGHPASLSREMVQGLLRGDLHYDGVVVSDDMQMKAITDHYGLPEAIRLAINAGVDMLIFGNQLVKTPVAPQEIVNLIHEEVMAGRILEQRIDEANRRIQRLTATAKVV